MLSSKAKAVFFTIIAGALWGTSFPLIKIGLETIDPFAFLFWRFLVSSITLVVVMMVLKKLTFKITNKKMLVLLGIANAAGLPNSHPSWTNEFCSLTKSTSALGFLGFLDLTGAGISIKGGTWEILPVWLVIAAIYFVWITGFAKAMDIIYERKRIPGVELAMQS